MTPTITLDVAQRQRTRSERQREAQARRAAEATQEPPPMTLEERKQARAERTARAPKLREQRRHSPAAFTPRERKERLTLSQRIAILEAAAEKGKAKGA